MDSIYIDRDGIHVSVWPLFDIEHCSCDAVVEYSLGSGGKEYETPRESLDL